MVISGAASAMVTTMLDFVRELKSLQNDMRTQVGSLWCKKNENVSENFQSYGNLTIEHDPIEQLDITGPIKIVQGNKLRHIRWKVLSVTG